MADFGAPTSRCHIAYYYSLTPPYIPTTIHARFDCGEHGPVDPSSTCTASVRRNTSSTTRASTTPRSTARAPSRAHNHARREACFSPRRGLSRRSDEEEEITARPCCYLWRWTWTRRRLRAGQAMRQKGLREPVQREHGIQIGRYVPRLPEDTRQYHH
ncbi:hypothetical protein C8J57DRAFT_1244018 [Mycena rebaudengoi]|nr:hypothetical protein C8J57DRAFT_1244018 [Mycena rebaudengoi]